MWPVTPYHLIASVYAYVFPTESSYPTGKRSLHDDHSLGFSPQRLRNKEVYTCPTSAILLDIIERIELMRSSDILKSKPPGLGIGWIVGNLDLFPHCLNNSYQQDTALFVTTP